MSEGKKKSVIPSVLIWILSIVILMIGVRYLWRLIRKYRNQDKLELGIPTYSFSDKINMLWFTNGVNIIAVLPFRSFADIDYKVNSIKADVYTPKGTVIARQTNAIEPFKIEPKGKASVTLNYLVYPAEIITLLKEGGFLDQFMWDKEKTLFQNITSIGSQLFTADYSKIKIRIKGFYVAEGFEYPIDTII